MDRENAAGVLGVPVDASPQEIRDAFRRRAREVHPDTGHGDGAAMAELNEAFASMGAAGPTGPNWDFAPRDPTRSAEPRDSHDSWDGWFEPPAQAESRSGRPLQWFGIAVAVAALVMTTLVFLVAVGYDWSVSP